MLYIPTLWSSAICHGQGDRPGKDSPSTIVHSQSCCSAAHQLFLGFPFGIERGAYIAVSAGGLWANQGGQVSRQSSYSIVRIILLLPFIFVLCGGRTDLSAPTC